MNNLCKRIRLKIDRHSISVFWILQQGKKKKFFSCLLRILIENRFDDHLSWICLKNPKLTFNSFTTFKCLLSIKYNTWIPEITKPVACFHIAVFECSILKKVYHFFMFSKCDWWFLWRNKPHSMGWLLFFFFNVCQKSPFSSFILIYFFKVEFHAIDLCERVSRVVSKIN